MRWALGVFTLLIGCATAAEEASSNADRSGPSSGGAAQDDTAARSIEFTEDAIVFVPGEPKDITVQVSPPGEYTVRFTLLGDPRDAFFAQSEVSTDADGLATTALTAPSQPATFTVRASVAGSISAEVPASAANVIGTVRVAPAYHGTRDVTTWIASVTTGHRCSDLIGNPPPDGSLLSEAPAGELPKIEYVPIGTPIAVTVRAGHFAGGCADAIALLPVLLNDVTVNVVDRPLQLDETDMPVSLAVDAATDWRSALNSVVTDVTSAFVGNALSDSHALLDAMQKETPTTESATAFSQARISDGWDLLLKETLGYTQATQGLRTLVQDWISQGLDALPSAPLLDGRLKADATASAVVFDLDSVAGASPTEMGFPLSTGGATWTADSDDTVHMGVNLSWTPSLFLAGLAYEPATTAVSGSSDVPAALASAYSCEDVANALTTNVDFAFGTCDAACVTNLCERALRTMWLRAARASGETSNMEIAAAGPASPIDDEARPLGFSGPWVGTTLLSSGVEVRFDGAATGGDVTALAAPQ